MRQFLFGTSESANWALRQAYSAPVTESGLPYALAGGVGAALVAGAAWSIRRRPHPVGAVA